MCLPSEWSAKDADEALRQVLEATLEKESLVAARDSEVNAIAIRYAPRLAAIQGRLEMHRSHLERYYESHRTHIEKDGQKRLQLGHGAIGMRRAANTALIPLSEKWTWDRIGKKLKSCFKTRFFHPPVPPTIDKVKVKKELGPTEMELCGLKLDDSETFYIEPNRLKTEKRAA